MAEQIVSKSEFARLIGVHPGRVTDYLDRGKIGPEAIVGEGRGARIRVEVAKAHLRVRLDSAQRLGNGLGTRLTAERGPPAEPMVPTPGDDAPPARVALNTDDATDDVSDDALDAELKREKLAALQRANRQAAIEEDAAQGRYVDAAAMRAEVAKIARRVISAFEGAIPEMAADIAKACDVPERDVVIAIHAAIRRVRAAEAERARKAAEAMPKLVPPSPLPSAPEDQTPETP